MRWHFDSVYNRIRLEMLLFRYLTNLNTISQA